MRVTEQRLCVPCNESDARIHLTSLFKPAGNFPKISYDICTARIYPHFFHFTKTAARLLTEDRSNGRINYEASHGST